MNLPNLKPPPLPPEERLRRFRLQATGLAAWPAGPEKDHMRIWLEAKIAEAQLAVTRAKGMRS
jgi:hypothetical protein